MRSADVKADTKQQEIKELVALSCIFYKKYIPSKLKIQQTCIFHLVFAWNSIQLGLVCLEHGVGCGRGYLIDKIC